VSKLESKFAGPYAILKGVNVGGLYTTANERCRFCSFKVPTKPVLVLTVHQKQRSDIYAAVKKLCLCELGVASQVSMLLIFTSSLTRGRISLRVSGKSFSSQALASQTQVTFSQHKLHFFQRMYPKASVSSPSTIEHCFLSPLVSCVENKCYEYAPLSLL
jgi:hypothetical protein